MTADSGTLKLDNQKNGWKGMCVHQEANGERFNCPVRVLAHCVLHLRNNGATGKTLLSLFFHSDEQYDVCGEDISRGLKMAATLLQYLATQGIPIERINTHSLQSGGANALALLGYSDTQIQKMSR
jgi:hypothetical protein